MKATKTVLSILILICFGFLFTASSHADTPYKFGTGGKNGLYYPVGSALAKVYNQSAKGPKIKVINTGGSIDNIKLLMQSKIQLAIVQADAARDAFKGKLAFQKGKPYKGLRALFALHNEVFTVVARQKSGIKKLADLKGKKVSVGEKGSGTLRNAKLALSVVGLKFNDLASTLYLKTQLAAKKLKTGEIDAFFFMVGHPNKLIYNLCKTKNLKINLVPIPHVRKKIMPKYKYYTFDYISKAYYRNIQNEEGVDSFGIKALVVVDNQCSKAMVRKLVDIIVNKTTKLKRGHRALKRLDPYDTVKGVSIPFHPTAEKIFRDNVIIY
jgi:TRAP transporter TAXI family solute receptor